MRFPPGGISVVLGGSGSGKSTLLRLIGGLIQAGAGRILVDGEDITRLRERELSGSGGSSACSSRAAPCSTR